MVQRARLQQSQVLRGVVLVLGVLGLLVCVALTLDFMLTKVGRAKDIASMIQSFATALAIVTGGIYALYKLQAFRTLEPHLTIEHRISHRRLSDSYVHIALTAMLHNSSRVHVELREGLFRLQGVSPATDDEIELLYSRVFVDRDFYNIQWPTLDEVGRNWNEGELVVEPGESHPETIEFIVSASDYESVLVYTYFHNPTQGSGSAQGWSATTVHDIVT